MRKKLISVLLSEVIAAGMVLCLPIGANAATENYDYNTKFFGYNIKEDNTVHLVSYIGTGTSTALAIPDTINGMDVTSIDNLFIKNSTKKITRLTLPNTLVSVPPFANSQLEEVVVGTGTKTLERRAFSYQTNLKKITFAQPSSLETIGEYAFSESGIEVLELPSSVKTIKSHAFYDCNSLVSVNVPGSVELLEDELFEGDSKLESLSLEEGITEIPSLSMAYISGLKKITIPSTVKEVKVNAFRSCLSLEEINFAGGEVICNSAFDTCTALKKVSFSKSLRELQPRAFLQCDNLESISVDSANPLYYSENGVLYCDNKTTLCKFPPKNPKYTSTSYEVDSDVKKIGDEAFYRAPFSEIKLPAGLKEIGTGVFYQAYWLKKIEVDSSNPYFESDGSTVYTKANAGKIEMVVHAPASDEKVLRVKEGTKIIRDYACHPCWFENLELPEGLEEIGKYSFFRGHCNQITLPSTLKKLGNYSFFEMDEITSIEVPSGVETIPKCCFYYCQNLEKVTLNEGLKRIESYAFGGTSVSELIVPDSVTEFEEMALTSNIKLLDLGSGVKRIEKTGTKPRVYPNIDKMIVRNPDFDFFENNAILPVNAVIAGYEDTDAKRFGEEMCGGFESLGKAYLKGDVNLDGEITVADATAVQKFLVGIITLTEKQQALADTDGDGLITVKDATEIQKYAAEMITTFEI